MIQIINNNNKIQGEITLEDGHYERNIEFNGRLISMERTVDHSMLGSTKTTVTFVEEPMIQSRFKNHINCRCNADMNILKTSVERALNKTKENKNMSVKIKKQPKEITLEELKQGNKYEEVIIHIDVEKQDEIEKKYGITYRYDDVLSSDMFGESNSEINFKEHYLIYGREKVPYDFIKKIEVIDL